MKYKLDLGSKVTIICLSIMALICYTSPFFINDNLYIILLFIVGGLHTLLIYVFLILNNLERLNEK